MKKNIKKVKRYQKPLICLIGILLLFVGFVVGKITNANADEINYEYESNNIDYDNSISNLSATNVKDAIDELYSKVGQCPSGYNCLTDEEFLATGSKFLRAYTYDEGVCVTGNETGCVIATCIEDGTICLVGTIIDYFVNNTTIVRFHVLHDDGSTMTMQSQSNIVYNVAWWSGGNDPTKGPQTIMGALKTATDGWTNVNPITITSGTTSFTGVNSIDNVCANNNGLVSCSGNVYDIGLITNTYRARMITIQEATDPNIGQCKAWVSDSQTNVKSCRMFMNNYLYQSNNGTFCKNTALCVQDDQHENGSDHNYGYWTMDAYSSNSAWTVHLNGRVLGYDTSDFGNGARAVVVVNK